MGWKTLKDYFGIGHHVQVSDRGILIGSGYVSDLITINGTTGELEENATFSSFAREKYPALLEASPNERLRLIQAQDVFTAAIPVYTYKGGEIVQELCETPGWPNVTHDGNLMYENSHSTDKATVIAWAKRSTASAVHYLKEDIARRENDLTEARGRLQEAEAERAKLLQAYPDIG